MKEIPLTQGMIAQVDDEDFEWLSQWKWTLQKNKQGHKFFFYATRRTTRRNHVSRKCIIMHRLIMNAPHGLLVDHKDGNGLNNKRSNLRICNNSQNLANGKQINHRKTSMFKGVRWIVRLNKWCARIGRSGKHYLGLFNTEEQAAKAYDEAAKKQYGEFSCLNFPG